MASRSVRSSSPGPGRPIPKDQEDLLKTFADQAVIAIERALV